MGGPFLKGEFLPNCCGFVNNFVKLIFLFFLVPRFRFCFGCHATVPVLVVAVLLLRSALVIIGVLFSRCIFSMI